MDRVLARFADPAGGFFDTADDHERLVTRPKDVQDNAVPSGNAMAADVLLRLHAWTGDGAYRAAAERAMRTVVPYVARYATGFARWLSAMDLSLAPTLEIAIVGPLDDPATHASARRDAARLPAEPGRGRGRRSVGQRDRAARRPDGRGRSTHRLRLSPVRVPAAGDRCGDPARAAPGRHRPMPDGRDTPGSFEAAVEPSPRRPSSSLRPGSAGLEVLLTRRPSSMAFAAGMHVFPGGRVDPADADPDLAVRSVLTAADAATSLGGDLAPAAALAAYVGAIRELFEEAGVLLADGGADATPVPKRLVSEARSALVGGDATFASIAAELDLRLRTDWLVPLSRWVTPPILPRRFDARFFAAELPAGARISFEGDEVAGHDWLTAAAALAAMARGEIGMWLPTSATLQQLEHLASIEEARERLTPGRLGEIELDAVAPEVTRIVMPAGGGVAGQPVCAYLVGRRRHVLIDPGDPTGPALDRAMALAAARGGSIVAIALTQVDPDHAGGAEALAEMLGIPILAGPGGGLPLPYPVRELADEEVVALGDVPLRAVWTAGPRPDHVAYLVGDRGLRGERAISTAVAAPDRSSGRGTKWPGAASLDRLRRLAPQAVWLAGHPPVRLAAGGTGAGTSLG